jgi:UDP-glucose 4-epimerase
MQPLHPFSLYGASKAAAEKYLSYHDLFAKTCVFRIAQVVGPGTPDYIAPVRMVQAAKRGENIPLFCTDATVRDYVHVEDVVKAITSAIRLQVSGVFNVGSGKPTKLAHLAKHITQLAGVRLEQANPNPKVPECAMWMSIKRARKYLSYEPTWTIERFVEEEIQGT